MWELEEKIIEEQDRKEGVEMDQVHLLILSFLSLLFINLIFLLLLFLFIVKEQDTNDFAIVKSTKQYANFINIPIPFMTYIFKGIDYRQFYY